MRHRTVHAGRSLFLQASYALRLPRIESRLRVRTALRIPSRAPTFSGTVTALKRPTPRKCVAPHSIPSPGPL